jgi:hypothetical protein
LIVPAMRGDSRLCLAILFVATAVVVSASPPESAAQVTPDTLVVASEPVTLNAHSPRGALWRAAAVPGWGQVYNRHYYKLPFVYGGLAGITYSAMHTHGRYRTYQEAYLFAEPRLWTGGSPQYPEFESAYRQMLELQGLAPDSELSPQDAADRRQRLAPNLRQIRDNLRRNRDLLYVGVGLFYAITILDAYVSAHLLDFDVGEDLTLSVGPTPVGMQARMSITF